MQNKAKIFFLLFVLYGVTCISKELSTSVYVTKIESPNLNGKELEELTLALGVKSHETTSLSVLDTKLKKIYNEGTYEALFLDMDQRGKESVLIIKGNKLKKIRKLSFIGLEDELADEIRRDSELRDNRPIGSKYISNVRTRLEGMLEHRGYFYSKVEIKLHDTPDGRESDMEITVDKNQPTKISKISFRGVSEDLEDEIRSYITFFPGNVFKKFELIKSGESINRYFKQNQYPTTRIEDTTLVFSPDKLKVEIVFLIKQNEKYQFQFVGNTVFPDVVLREFLTDEVLSQADASSKIISLIENKYKSVGYHFCQVKIENQLLPDEKLNVAYFRINEGRKLLIDRVDFNGGEKVGISTLSKWMYEEAPGVLGRGVYWEEGLLELTQKLQRRLRREGYLSASVTTPRSVFSNDRLGAELIFEVQPGQRTFLHQIELEGIKRISKEEILKKIDQKENQPFNVERIEEIKTTIESMYLRDGFADVQVKGGFKNFETYELSQDQKLADIKLNVTEGTQYYVGDIFVEGNKRTDADVIQRELKLGRGDKYDLQQVRASEDEVSLLGLFTRVEIVPSTNPVSNSIKDLRVIVVETKRGSGELGLGGAYEDPRFRVKTFLGLAYKNLFGRNQTVSARTEVDVPFSAGYHLVPFLEYSGVLSYRLPYPVSLPFIFSSQVGLDSFEVSSAVDGSYISVQRKAKVEEKIERKISSTVTLLYRLHRYEHTRDLDIQIQDRDPNAKPLKDEENDIGSTGPGIILDFRDDPFNPFKGSYHTFDFELASKHILSKSDFYMATLRNSFYIPLFNSVGFTFFLGGAFAEGTQEAAILPTTRLKNELALGGQGSIRGYRKIFIPDESSHSAAYYNTRMEVSVPIYPNISLALFLDSGQIYSRKVSEPWKTNPRYDGVGIGFRYKTAVGPIVFDMAEGLTDPGKGVKFLFTIGTF